MEVEVQTELSNMKKSKIVRCEALSEGRVAPVDMVKKHNSR